MFCDFLCCFSEVNSNTDLESLLRNLLEFYRGDNHQMPSNSMGPTPQRRSVNPYSSRLAEPRKTPTRSSLASSNNLQVFFMRNGPAMVDQKENFPTLFSKTLWFEKLSKLADFWNPPLFFPRLTGHKLSSFFQHRHQSNLSSHMQPGKALQRVEMSCWGNLVLFFCLRDLTELLVLH